MKSFYVFVGIVFLGLFISCYSTPATPLYSAAAYGDLSKVMRLVEKGVDINETAYGNTPLEIAAINGNYQIVEYLLENKAKVSQKAFESAMWNKHIRIAKYLIDAEYIDVNASALSFREFFNDETISFEQRMKNAKDFSNNKLNSPNLLILVQPKNYQNVVNYFRINLSDKIDELGSSILHRAVRNNEKELVEYLINCKFDVNTLDNSNHNALFYNITSASYTIDWAAPITEDEITAKINFRGDMPYYDNLPKLRSNRADITILLIDAGININQQNKYGWTILHFVFAAYPDDIKEFLISKGAKQDIKTNFGRTANEIPRQL